MREIHQYTWLRSATTVLGGTVLTALAYSSIHGWSVITRAVMPVKLACGCAVLAVKTPWWITGIAGVVMLVTVYSFSRLVLSVTMQWWRSRQYERWLIAGFDVSHDRRMGFVVAISESPKIMAVTIGLLRPHIIITRGLLNRLTPEEQRAVLRHERAHQQVFDPLMTAWLNGLASAFHWLPGARSLQQQAYSFREVAADAVATDGYTETTALSSAFVKLSDTVTHPLLSSFSPNADRLEKLLDRQWRAPRRWWSWSSAIFIVAITVGLFSMVRYVQAATPSMPPTAATACHETRMMCASHAVTAAPHGTVCTNGQYEALQRRWSSAYGITILP